MFNSIHIWKTKSARCLYYAYGSSFCSLTSKCILQIPVTFELPIKRIVNKLACSACQQEGNNNKKPLEETLRTLARHLIPATIKMFTVLMIPLSAMLSSTTALEKAGQQLDFSLPLILFLVLPLSAFPLPAFPFKTSIRFTYRAVQSSHTD